jgi:DNA-binding response OmpR family regulator
MNDDNMHGASQNAVRSVAVVTRDPRPDLLDTVLGAGDYDVVFVESLSRAYSCIKRATPDLVIVYLEIDDPESFQLLSMLAIDAETARIPVCTCVVTPQLAESDAAGGGSLQSPSTRPIVASSMN